MDNQDEVDSLQGDDKDSLFDGTPSPISHSFFEFLDLPTYPASRLPSPFTIPGLHFDPEIQISKELESHLLESISRARYFTGETNQVMLFGTTLTNTGSSASPPPDHLGLPPFISLLLDHLRDLLLPIIPQSTHALLFPAPGSALQARQAILNLYRPGEGISPHIDLLQRFGDGIIGVSLCAGTVMDFRKVIDDHAVSEYSLWLPERSVIVLEGDARYKWTHGIAGREFDYVEGVEGPEWIRRGERISITLRWLLPGADVVGGFEVDLDDSNAVP